MFNKTASRVLWAVGSFLSLGASCLIVRYPFFELHKMMEWPFDLFVCGAFVIGIAAIFDARKTMISVVFGYIFGFLIGAIFNTNGVDPGGGTTNNFWILWTFALLVCIFIGIVWDMACRCLKRKI